MRPGDRRRLRSRTWHDRPVRDQSRAAAPRRRVRGAARARGRAVRAGRREVRHGGGGTGAAGLPFPHQHVAQRDVHGLARDGGFRAVVAGLSGRIALPAAHRGARRAGVPFVLWATIWRHPRTAAHAVSYLPLRHLYRDADAIVTYGPHVSAYVRTKGALGAGARGASGSRHRVLVGRRTESAASASLPSFVCRSSGRGERPRGTYPSLARLRFSSPPHRAGSGRRRAVPSPVLRHQRGAARRAPAA